MSKEVLWCVVGSGPDLSAWAERVGSAFLTPSEQIAFSGLRLAKRKHEWLLGRWTAKQLILSNSGLDPGLRLENLAIHNQPDGVPYPQIEGLERLPGNLSISHRDGLAACAWTTESDVRAGIDVDMVEKREGSFLEGNFSTSEQAFARALPENVRDFWITLAWSAKEAVLKALGVGLRLDARRVEIRQTRGLFKPEERMTGDWNELSIWCTELPEEGWQVGWQRLGEHVLTLATWSEEPSVNLRMVKVSEN
jgi:4'-phosphopantetheinyl transferase